MKIKIKKTILLKHRKQLRKDGWKNKTIEKYIESKSKQQLRKIMKRDDIKSGGMEIKCSNSTNFVIRLDKPIIINNKKVRYLRQKGVPIEPFITEIAYGVKNDNSISYIFSEGEKKVIIAEQFGFAAIGNPGVWGWSKDKKMLPKLIDLNFTGRVVYIIYDADKNSNPQVMLAEKRFAEALIREGADVRIVDLPEGYKLDDYLVEFGKEAVDKLLELAKSYRDLNIPTIAVDPSDIRSTSEKIWRILAKNNEESPVFFIFCSQLVRIIFNGVERQPRISPVDEYDLRHHIVRLINLQKINRDGEKSFWIPSRIVLKDILAFPWKNLPYLEGILNVPFFDKKGNLQIQSGFSQESRIYLKIPDGFNVPKVNNHPSKGEIAGAKKLLLEIFIDFPFASKADLANTLGLVFLLFIRPMINDPTPLHLVSKSTPGIGGSLLVRCISMIATGRDFITLPEGTSEEEWRKRITAAMRLNPALLVVDNLSRKLDSPILASVLTASLWSDRLLGKSEHIQMPVKCAWVATGNNPTLSDEMTRRSILIRLVSKEENPQLNSQDSFLHSMILDWIKIQREEIIWAICTLIQNWVSKGCPKSKKRLGMYEQWASLVGGILETIDFPEFMGNLNEFYDDVNEEKESIRAFVSKWFEKYKEKDVLAKELIRFAISAEIDCNFELQDDLNSRFKFGIWISKLKDRVFEVTPGTHVRIEKSRRKFQNTTLWKLNVVKKRKLVIKQKKK